MSSKGESTNAAESKYNALFYPILAFSLFLGLWSCPLRKDLSFKGWKWFDYHPISMSIGFVALASLAALKKRIGGKGPTIMHGNMANAGMLTGIAGWYVIYSNKEILGKQHLTSLHGKLGAASLVSFIVLGLVGFLGLHPDFGKIKTNQVVRKIHKFFGRAAILLSWGAIFTGFAKFEPSMIVQGSVVAAMIALSYFVMI